MGTYHHLGFLLQYHHVVRLKQNSIPQPASSAWYFSDNIRIRPWASIIDGVPMTQLHSHHIGAGNTHAAERAICSATEAWRPLTRPRP
jgi:hypothetical protein